MREAASFIRHLLYFPVQLGILVQKRMNISCSKCDALFNINDVDEHAGHAINEEYINSVLNKPGNFGEQMALLNRKRKHQEEKDGVN